MRKIIISDTSCFIILNKIGEIDLLRKFNGIIPSIKPLLFKIKETNFRISNELEIFALKEAGEF
jgi:predicted nucleic acid-binding protein